MRPLRWQGMLFYWAAIECGKKMRYTACMYVVFWRDRKYEGGF